jgi:Flp pilus assembly protein TadD
MYIIMNRKMNNLILPKRIITIVITLCALYSTGLLFAQETKVSSSRRPNKDALQTQARQYREAGLENQRIGNLPEAMSLYQKAIALDPSYAVVYNDLGVIYESTGLPEQAEENYLKSIKIDPTYLSAYTNLALFYEIQRNLEKAAYYWAKRAELGLSDDPWTRKAASRLKDIRLVLSNKPISDEREEQVLGLMKDVVKHKSVINKDDKTLAQDHFQKAKQSYNRGDLATATKEALDAQNLDQDNPEIEAFIEKTELRALSR